MRLKKRMTMMHRIKEILFYIAEMNLKKSTKYITQVLFLTDYLKNTVRIFSLQYLIGRYRLQEQDLQDYKA